MAWDIATLVLDIKRLVQSGGLKLKWISRTENPVADKVASLALRGSLSPLWRFLSPFDLRSILASILYVVLILVERSLDPKNKWK